MYPTVKAFVNRLWYIQEFILIDQREFDRCNDSIGKMIDHSLFHGTAASTGSETFKKYNNLLVTSYGAFDGVIVVIV